MHVDSDRINYTGGQPSRQTDRREKSGETREAARRACYRCGASSHLANTCSYRTIVCRICQKKGHIARVCRSRPLPPASSSRTVNTVEEYASDPPGEYLGALNYLSGREPHYLNSCQFQASRSNGDGRLKRGSPPVTLNVEIDGRSTLMEVDTGASVSVIALGTLEKKLPALKSRLTECSTNLFSYSGKAIPVIGEVEVEVKVAESTEPQKMHKLPLVVVDGEGHTLLGRSWLREIRLDWHNLFVVNGVQSPCGSTVKRLEDILEEHKAVFEEGLGTYSGPHVSIRVKPDSVPKFCKVRPVPYAQREAVEEELARLERQGIIEPVQHSEWASPVVTVLKADGSIRLCGDYKRTLNPYCVVDQYPMPRIEDTFAQLAGCKKFTKIDLSQAYLQLTLNEESRKFTTVNTSRGLYQFRRMPFGVASASAIFQRTIESVVRGVPHMVVRADDILVSGLDDEEHLFNVNEVLSRLERAGLRAKRQKCRFLQPEVIYMGYAVNEFGHYPDKTKVEALLNAPEPDNVSKLKSYLGMLNYYAQFIPQAATLLEPFHRLLRSGEKWSWGAEQKEVFQKTKKLLCSAPVLAHYNPSWPLRLACDASPFGVGAVLSQVDAGGKEHPIGFASRALATAERNYCQFEKEALAIVYGVKHFHNYLYGQRFTLITDHRPLLGVFGTGCRIPDMASARMIRWCLMLQDYTYDLVHKAGERHQNADALSRLPCNPPPRERDIPMPGEVIQLLKAVESMPITAKEIANQTRRDSTMSKVQQYVLMGWPTSIDEHFKAFHRVKGELSIVDNCILRGARMIIPPPLRKQVLEELHEGHPGMTRMKALARSYVWWPHLDEDIERHVGACMSCQDTRPSPPVAPLQVWDWPQNPWQRLHADYAGPVEGRYILVVIDAHSKWIEAVVTYSQTASATVNAMRRMFATHGIPQKCVTDNGPCFASKEFTTFLETNGVESVRSTPYHPATNGLAEKAVQTVKQGIAKQRGSRPLEEKLLAFLLTYRVTPHCTTGVTPSELLMGRILATRLNRLFPDISERVKREQQRQICGHNAKAQERKFDRGDRVFVKNFSSTNPATWLSAVVTDIRGPVSYVCFTSQGERRYHVDQMRRRSSDTMAEPIVAEPIVYSSESTKSLELDFEATSAPRSCEHGGTKPLISDADASAESRCGPEQNPEGGGKDCKNATEDNQNATNGPPDEEHLSPGIRLELRRSSRVSQKPDRYGY